uniref:Uncharacterized protein n=1 Tax=Steinernema glaseri TaxID=37863 RepID=A0A1I8AB25_9BILA
MIGYWLRTRSAARAALQGASRARAINGPVVLSPQGIRSTPPTPAHSCGQILEELIRALVDLSIEDDSLESVMLGTQLAVMTCICCKSCHCCCIPARKGLKAIEGTDAYDVPGKEHIPKKVKRTPEKDVLRANRQARKELAEWHERRSSLSLLETGWLFRRSKSEAVLRETTETVEASGSCTTLTTIPEKGMRKRPPSLVLPPPPPLDLTLRRCESEQPKALKSCLVTGQSRRWGSVQDESGFFAEVVPLQGTSACAFQIKKAKVKKSDSRKGGLKSMKKGFKQFFTQDRSQREYESEHELTPQQSRRGSGGGLFQKLFRANGKPDASPRTLSPLGSPMSARRVDWESEDDYAEILNARAKSNERDLNFYPGAFASGKKRECKWCRFLLFVASNSGQNELFTINKRDRQAAPGSICDHPLVSRARADFCWLVRQQLCYTCINQLQKNRRGAFPRSYAFDTVRDISQVESAKRVGGGHLT